MKIQTIIILVVLALAITFGQWAMIMGEDDFTIVDSHKVFTYGFPFRIADCAPELPVHTPSWQVPFRLGGNFAFSLFVSFCVVWFVRRVRERIQQCEAVA